MCMCVCVHLFVMSHHLVLLPRSLEVQAAILSVLNDCPSTAGCFHVAIHLHSGDQNERRSVGKPVFEHIKTLIAPIGLFFIKTKKRFLTSRQSIPTLSLTLSGFNRQWEANWTIVRCQTLLFSPALMTTHLQECNAFWCPPQTLIGVSLSLNSSPEMFLTGGASMLQDQSWGSWV